MTRQYMDYKDRIDRIEISIISKALRNNNFSVRKTAKDLRMNRTTLFMKMQKLGIKREEV